MLLLFQPQLSQNLFPPGPVVWMKRSLRKSSIKYESQKWHLVRVVLRQGSGSVSTARLKTLTTGRIVKSVVSHCDDPVGLEESTAVNNV